MTTASNAAYTALRQEILTGTRGPGQRLGEIEISQELGVSRTPVREALRRLAADGLVEIAAQRGARVISPKVDEILEIFDLRERLETAGAAAAAANITAPQLAELEELARRMATLAASRRSPEREVERAEANRRFHDLILVASGQARLRSMVSELMVVPIVLGTFRSYSDRELERSTAHHTELVEAMTAGDPDWAAAVMRSHIRAARAAATRLNAAPDESGPARSKRRTS